VIKYIGSKRRLVGLIAACVDALPGVETVLDLFSGTARVGRALKARGYRVVANDHNAYAWVLARCYVEADGERVRPATRRLLGEMAGAPPHAGWFTETFCRRARYFTPENGAQIEGMRRWIAARALPSDVEAVLLTALMEAADRVDSTTGVQMAYLKRWAPRALKPVALRHPEVVDGPGVALFADATLAAAEPADLAYLDPPYNQHCYRSNYHVWETLVRYDRPESYGVACKRVDCRTLRSAFNRRASALDALRGVLERIRARHLVVSFSDEGFHDRDTLTGLLAPWGDLRVIEVEQDRYVGAKIGIHDRRGRRVGTVGRLRNRELIFVASPDASTLDGAMGRLAG
jgi:adenine-specific DNA-methyltransferase